MSSLEKSDQEISGVHYIYLPIQLQKHLAVLCHISGQETYHEICRHLVGTKTLPKWLMTQFTDAYMCPQALMS